MSIFTLTKRRLISPQEPLPPEEKKLRTVGLWVGLHGESFLDAGMHHLECRFDYALLREQLAAAHIKTMAPFSDFPFLKQAFTQGERWAVRPERITRLLREDLLTDEQAQKFSARRGDRKSPGKPATQRRLQGFQPEISQRHHRVD